MSNTKTHERTAARQRFRSGNKGTTRPTRVVLRLPDVSRREEPVATAPPASDDPPALETATAAELSKDETPVSEDVKAEPAKKQSRKRSNRRNSETPRSRWGSLAMQGLIVLSLIGFLGLAYVAIVNLGGSPVAEEEGTPPLAPGDPTGELVDMGDLQITAPTGEVEAPPWDSPPNAFQAGGEPATGSDAPPAATGLNLQSPQLDAGYTPRDMPRDAGPPPSAPVDTGVSAQAASAADVDVNITGQPVPWQETPGTPVYQYNRTDSNRFQYPPYEEAGATAGNGFNHTGVQR